MDTTASEVTRVAQHIGAALQQAAARDVSQLTHVQRLIRTLLLDELEWYRAEGRFPKNPDFAERTPYFVDAEGTRCAMAHALELGGQGELVQRIAASRNNARVRELADEPGLLEWLDAAGLSVDEAAAIQPSYSCSARSECVCGGGFSFLQYPVPAKGVLEVVVEAGGKGRVEQTYGDSLGISVGSTVQLEAGTTGVVGTRLLVPIDSAAQPDGGPASYYGVAVGADGQYHCSSQGVADAPALSKADFAKAVTATSCKESLAAVDPKWGQSCGSGPMGCNVGGDASVGILLALVSAIVARRFR